MNSLTKPIILILTTLTGSIPSFGYDDLSKGKTASQSSTWDCKTQLCINWYLASNAVDRDTATCTRNKAIGIRSADRTVWWKVDLGATYNIYSIDIMFKNYDGQENRQRGRFAGFSLYISNSDVWNSDSPCYLDGPALPPLNFTAICMGYGRYITFFNERLSGVQYPAGYELIVYTEICDVIVKGYFCAMV